MSMHAKRPKRTILSSLNLIKSAPFSSSIETWCACSTGAVRFRRFDFAGLVRGFVVNLVECTVGKLLGWPYLLPLRQRSSFAAASTRKIPTVRLQTLGCFLMHYYCSRDRICILFGPIDSLECVGLLFPFPATSFIFSGLERSCMQEWYHVYSFSTLRSLSLIFAWQPLILFVDPFILAEHLSTKSPYFPLANNSDITSMSGCYPIYLNFVARCDTFLSLARSCILTHRATVETNSLFQSFLGLAFVICMRAGRFYTWDGRRFAAPRLLQIHRIFLF